MNANRPHGLSRASRFLAGLALLVGVVCAVAALLPGPAYRLQWMALPSAFLTLRWATYGAMGAAVAAVLAWLLLTLTRAAAGRVMATIAFIVSAIVAAPGLVLSQQAQSVPKIHDISTDIADPPLFVDVLPLRRGARNPVDYPAATAAQQKSGYPDIVPLRLNLPPAQAFERAAAVARTLGWQIVSVNAEALRIEATDTTLMFGFKDDIVIRVRADAQGSVIDMRSLSRIGGSDIGTNARRVRDFLKRMAAG